MNKFMKMAVDEAYNTMRENAGGPFGAVIVRNGEVIAVGRNKVITTNDPTAHAEVVAIRKATKLLGTFDLSDCEIYSSCEPCPMCFSAIHWAKMKNLYFGATRYDAAEIGFDDQYIYDVLEGKASKEQVVVKNIDHEDSLGPFKEWSTKHDKVKY